MSTVRKVAALQTKIDLEHWPIDNPICPIKAFNDHGGCCALWVHLNKPAQSSAKKTFDTKVWKKRISGDGLPGGKKRTQAICDLREELMLQLREETDRAARDLVERLPSVVAAAQAELEKMTGSRVKSFRQLVEGAKKAEAAMKNKVTYLHQCSVSMQCINAVYQCSVSMQCNNTAVPSDQTLVSCPLIRGTSQPPPISSSPIISRIWVFLYDAKGRWPPGRSGSG